MEKISRYSKIFDEKSVEWNKDREYNLLFLKTQETYANRILKVKGFLLLNDIYDLLGFRRTREGCVVGWIYDETNEIGDNFIDFGIQEIGEDIVLDFNVDGYILDRIPEE